MFSNTASPRLPGPAWLALLLAVPAVLRPQSVGTPVVQPSPGVDSLAAKPGRLPAPLYESVTPLVFTFTANLDRLRRDRDEDAPWRPATIIYVNDDGTPARMPLRARTRGIWRLRNCHFPPLRLNFWGDSTRGTLLAGVDKPKLVNYCRDSDRFEEYVLQELQLYRIYQLLTPFSHRTRLLRLSYADSANGRVRTTRWAFLLEEPAALARRVGAETSDIRGFTGHDLDPYQHVLYAVFQYMIGNTDWSVHAQHNAEVLFKDGAYIPVAYDFDYSGAVDAEYAVPAPQLHIRDVRERVYRGYCVGDEHVAAVVSLFNDRRAAITALYEDEVGRLLRPRTVERTLRYFDEFYRTINDPRTLRSRIIDRCGGK